ncbi:MAG: hypothetical protein SGI74_06515 [Oligoflexia bacterium]|nr:hypothetical protein [Oligoflexia bacterium]
MISGLFWVATTLVALPQAYAVPPEGLEAYALGGRGGKNQSLLYVNAGYVNPSWLSDYETFQTYVSVGNRAGNYITAGGHVTAGNRFADRDGYFIRYDQTFYNQSMSLKLTHIDYRYINAGKNIISLNYNAGLGIGKTAKFYFALGMYYRFSLNSWNTPTWSPTNYNTEDKEYYPEFCFGTKLLLNGDNYITVDLNNRDVFNSYNGDNLASDVTLNLVSGKSLTWRLTSSTRYSSLLSGTANVNEQTFLLGIMTGL